MHTFHRFPGRARGRGRAGACAALLLAATVTLAGCSGSSDSGAGAESAARPAASATGTSGPGAAGPDGDAAGQEDGGGSAADRKGKAKETGAPQASNAHIIRTATLSVHVKDVSKAITRATAAAEDAGGYVADETTYGTGDGGGAARSELVLRVPQERYEHVLDALSGTGKLVERQVKAEDVTDQVVDVDSRVKSQRASVARVRDLMDRATDLTDVVSLEGELSTREAELESLLAQQASLKDRTTLATITLNVSAPEHGTAKKPEDDGTGFLDALSGGWHALVTGVGWLVIAFGAVLPFAVPVVLLAMVWQRFGRPRLAARRAAQSRPAAVVGSRPGSAPAGGGGAGSGQPNGGQNSTP